MAATKAQIAALYVGYFNRGADPEGLNYWLGQTQMSVVEIANSFAVQPEATATYAYLAAPNLNSVPAIDAFITEVYQNVFERAPDAAGLAYWRAEILAGKPPGRVVVDIESGAQGDDKIILDRKTEISTYYAEQFALNGDTPWTAADDLSGAAGALAGDRAFWLSVNAIPNAKGTVNQIVADSFAETLNLTPGPDDLTGTSADDVFNGAAQPTALLPIQTLNTDDSLNGGGGRNTLNAQLVDPFVVPNKLTNIQVVNINQPSGLTPVIVALLVPVTLDVVNANAIDTVNFRAPVQDVTIASVTTALQNVSITDNTFPALGGREFTISHVGPATNGANDDLTIALRNDNVDTILNLTFQPGGGYEVISIDSTGPLQNRFELNASPREIFITGDADLRIRGEALNLDSLRVFNSLDLDAPAGVDARFHGGMGGTTNVDTGDGADHLVFEAGTAAVLNINTNGGDDFVDLWDHTGNVTANLGDGADYFEVDGTGNMDVAMGEGNNEAQFGDVTGNVMVTAGAGNDKFFFENILVAGPGSGNVTANAGNGDNYLYFHKVDGMINAVAGTGDDVFDFDDVWQGGGVGRHTFGPGDVIDGGAGNNRVIFEVESHGAGDLQLLSGGTITNIQTAVHKGEFTGASDLLVDFERLGSVTRLELRGEYGDDVRITNLNNTDGGIDTVAIQSDIADDLVLTRAFVTIPAFHIEIGNDYAPDGTFAPGVVVGQLLAGEGTDLFTITSVGGGTNEFTDVGDIDGNVILKGDTNLNFGSDGESNAYDENGGQIDATNLTGNDQIWVDDGRQTVLDGAGDDFIGTWDNDNSADLIKLAAGANTVRFHDFNNDFNGGNLGGVPRDLHEVTGFNVGSGAEADRLQVSLNSGGLGFDDIEDTDNHNVVAGTFANIRSVEVGDVINLQDSHINFLKFTTAATGGNVEDLFDTVLGAGVIDVANGTDWVMASAYDTAFVNADGSHGAMVVFAIDAGNQITSGDNCVGLTTVGMSYTDYLAFESGNFQFVA